jgi:predicted short-subunit dehydrogenase-like oxidoreductase (DUF2520 family)
VKITIVGPGNLAHSLLPALQEAGHEVCQVMGRRLPAAQALADQHGVAEATSLTAALAEGVELVWLTVADQAIAGVAEALAAQRQRDAIFVHSSGSTALSALDPLGPRIGVLYPLQMFTRLRPVAWHEVPLMVEGQGEAVHALWEVATSLSNRVQPLASGDRLRLHLGAVMASNFSNYLFRLAEQQLGQGLAFSIYEPLLREQMDRVFELGPAHTQTGPAKRGDQATMKQHLDLLADQPELATLYHLLSQLIEAAE